MTDKTIQWIREIDRLTGLFEKHFGKLSPEQLNQKPASGGWSIAQNIEHIIKLNESYFPILREIKEGSYQKPFAAKIPLLPRFFGKVLLKYVDAERKKKTTTFPLWEPVGEYIDGALLKRFQEQQEMLKKLIEENESSIHNRTVIASPANKNLVYPLDRLFEILLEHEERHLNQALEVLNEVNS